MMLYYQPVATVVNLAIQCCQVVILSPEREGATLGRMQRNKGYRVENEVRKMFNEIGLACSRVPLSGGAHFKGQGEDLSLTLPNGKELKVEVKARGNGGGFTTITKWLNINDVLIVKEDRKKPLVVLPWSTWEYIVTKIDLFYGV